MNFYREINLKTHPDEKNSDRQKKLRQFVDNFQISLNKNMVGYIKRKNKIFEVK